jgi:hypothetical protein
MFICPFVDTTKDTDCSKIKCNFFIFEELGYKSPFRDGKQQGCAFFLVFQYIYQLQQDFSKFQEDFGSFIEQYKTTTKGENK